MTDKTGNDDTKAGRAFRKERAVQAREGVRIERDTAAEVTRLFKLANKKIAAELAGQPSDYKQWYLPRLQQAIRQAMKEHGDQATEVIGAAADRAWSAGVDLVDKPIAAGGINIAAQLPMIDRDQVMAMKTFATDQMQDVTTSTVNRINTQLGLVVVGAQGPSAAITKIAKVIDGGRGRAIGVVRKEVGGAFAAATQARLMQAKDVLPEVRKQWRRSGKLQARPSHDVADGQVQKVDEPFLVGGIQIMHPRSAAAPIAHTANCGCTELPYMGRWELTHPGAKPFSDVESNANPNKRNSAYVRAENFGDWVDETAAGKRKPTGQVQTVAQIPAAVLTKLTPRGIAPGRTRQGGPDILIGDRQVVHMRRDLHVKKKHDALPAKFLRELPQHLAKPDAVLLDRRAKVPTLQFVLRVPGQSRLARITVKLGDQEKRNAHQAGNLIVAGQLVDRRNLADAEAYEVLMGRI